DHCVSTTYGLLPQDVRPGDRILLSDGAIELRVEQVRGQEVRCVVVHGGMLGEYQGINLPGIVVSAPALTAKYRQDLAFRVRHPVDYIALSFIRRPEDLREARRLIIEALAEAPAPPEPYPSGLHPSAYAAATTIPIIAKLEKPEAIQQLDAILEV